MGSPEEAKKKATNTYNAASDHFDSSANSFWERFGRRTVDRLDLRTGASVLDVCCGSGASALPAAGTIGPPGLVLGVDLAENLLELARRKAKQQGLNNVEFRPADFLELGLPSASFDAVVCVFGIFFVPDMTAAVSELRRLVRPGGKLAITTWGPRFLEPVSTAFWDSIRSVRPELHKSFNPWDRIVEPEALGSVFSSAGIQDVEIVAEPGTHPLDSPEDWWSMVLGTGYRGTVDLLEADESEQVRRENLDFIRTNGVHSLEANVVYAVSAQG